MGNFEEFDGMPTGCRRVNCLKMTLCGALIAGFLFSAVTVNAQEGQGPQKPPPEEHTVKRVTVDQPPPEAPPGMPQALIVKHFAEKEEEYARARVKFGYKKTIKLTEYGADGNPMG